MLLGDDVAAAGRSDEDVAFQNEVRDFLAAILPAHIKDQSDRGLHIAREDLIRWQKILAGKGWMAPNWPVEYGGPGWDLTKKYIFNHEYFLSGAPQVSPFGVSMVGPVIYTFGNEEQKAKYLPDILGRALARIWIDQSFAKSFAFSINKFINYSC